MAYPQASPDEAIVNGAGFVRIRTPLASPGDIYESQQSSAATAIGPDSDIAVVNINYFDGQVAPSFINQVAVSCQRTFTGTLAARNDATYSGSGDSGVTEFHTPGRLLIWPADIYDPNYIPSDFDPDDDIIENITPILDVLLYASAQQSLVPARIDKSYELQNFEATGITWTVFPFYGRKYAFVEFSAKGGGVTPSTITIRGVNYAVTPEAVDAGAGTPYHQEYEILASTSVAPGDPPVRQIITATTQGMFDALVIGIHSAGATPLRVITSDTI